jgi:hypothetical protein
VSNSREDGRTGLGVLRLLLIESGQGGWMVELEAICTSSTSIFLFSGSSTIDDLVALMLCCLPFPHISARLDCWRGAGLDDGGIVKNFP